MSSKSRSAGSASVKDQRFATLLQRFAPQIAWLRRRLSPGEYFSLQLAAGALLFAGAAWVLGGITQDVIEGDVLAAVAKASLGSPCATLPSLRYGNDESGGF
jgi:hypothetical protein